MHFFKRFVFSGNSDDVWNILPAVAESGEEKSLELPHLKTS
jgi:hypothetical protein